MHIRLLSLLFTLNILCFNLFSKVVASQQIKTNVPTFRTTIAVKLKENEQFILNYKDNFGRCVIFKNYGSSDTLLKKTFLLTKPTIFHYILDPFTNDFRSLIVLPGDSIVLFNLGKKVAFSTSFPDYIENLIDIPALFYQHNPILIKELNKVSANSSTKFIQGGFERNRLKISNANLSTCQKDILDNLNDLIKYQLFSYIEGKELTVKEALLLDSINRSTIDHIQKVESINTSLTEPLIRHLIEWKYAKKNSVLVKGFWADINTLDADVMNAPFYINYLFDLIQTYFIYDYKKLSVIATSLRGTKNSNPAIKSALFFCDILLKTKSDFKGARQALESFEDGKYLYLFKNEVIANHELRNTIQIKPVILCDVRGQTVSFSSLLDDDEAIYFIDFWASWCKPCVEDYPYLKSAQVALKNESIKFVSISIDNKGSTGNWQAMLKKIGAHNDTDQYILENSKESPLTNFLSINSIPRYVIVDKTGNILDEDFFRPSDPRFVIELLKLSIGDK